ncbi:MAG: hypothetical protein AAF577_04670 [Pseudomonadota bacterium]
MAEPPLDPLARLVERADPVSFRAALFAAPPARERLMTFAAFDIELSRAAAKAPGRDEGPLLAQMRLQFWRDRIEAARSGAAYDADTRHHEVAAPLQAMLAGALRPHVDRATDMVAARLTEIEGFADQPAWHRWADQRFAARYRLALAALDIGATGEGEQNIESAVADLGLIAATGFTLRNLVQSARDGRVLLPAIHGDGLAALQRGELMGEARLAVESLLAEANAVLNRLKDCRAMLSRRAMPALLPLIRDRRTISLAERQGVRAAANTAEPGAVRLLYAVVTGRL